MFSYMRLFNKAPGRNQGGGGVEQEHRVLGAPASPSASAHLSSSPLPQGVSPFHQSPHPKRRNTNPSPGSRVLNHGVIESSTMSSDIKHHWKSADLENADTNIGHDLFEPPRLHSTAVEGIFPTTNSALMKVEHHVITHLPPTNITKSNMRTKEAVVNHRMKVLNGLDFPDRMPMGPCPTFQMLYEEINNWAKDPSTGGGSFSVKKDSTSQSTKNRGPSQKIICSRGGCNREKTIHTKDDIEQEGEQQKQRRDQQQPSQIIGCPWEIWTELTTEGWMVTQPTKKANTFALDNGKNVCLWHSHELAKTLEERLVFASMRELPKGLQEFADHLNEGGCMAASEIYTALVAKCRRENIEITFIQSDIKNRYQTCHGETILDCTHLVQHLKERQREDHELDYDVVLDGSTGKLDHVFFVLKEGKTIWQRSKGAVLLFDTKHGTNRYGMKLGCFVTIDERGKTRVLAGSFIRSEDEASFTWAFKCFQNSFRSPPVVLYTDSDAAMAAATKAAWPKTVHLLCTFHLWKNFWEHIRPLFYSKGGDDNSWRTIGDLWWRLCKTSDEGERACFDEKFNTLVTMVKEHAVAKDDKVNKQLNWLSSLLSRKEQWAACYTWKHKTFGIHSTQRAEAIHSAIAVFCSKGSSIVDITKDLEQMADEHTLKNKMQRVAVMLRGTISNTNALLPGLERTAARMEPFPRIMMNAQAALLTKYDCSVLDGNTPTTTKNCFLVVPTNAGEIVVSRPVSQTTKGSSISDYDGFNREADHGTSSMEVRMQIKGHKTTLTQCSCQYPKVWGIPCRHILRVMFHLSGSVLRDADSWERCLVSRLRN